MGENIVDGIFQGRWRIFRLWKWWKGESSGGMNGLVLRKSLKKLTYKIGTRYILVHSVCKKVVNKDIHCMVE